MSNHKFVLTTVGHGLVVMGAVDDDSPKVEFFDKAATMNVEVDGRVSEDGDPDVPVFVGLECDIEMPDGKIGLTVSNLTPDEADELGDALKRIAGVVRSFAPRT